MILVDNRKGSAELEAPLTAIGLPVRSTRLEYGDVAVEGRGEGGKPIKIGIELKTLPDLVASLRSGRLQGHQLPGLRETYTYSFLLVEGELHYSKKGLLTRRVGAYQFRPLGGHMTVNELFKRVVVLYLRGGLLPLWVATRRDTIQVITALYQTFTDKNLDEHTSHLGVHQPPALVKVSDFRRAIMQWPGIGLHMSKAAELEFGGSLIRAAIAQAHVWATIATTDTHGKTKQFGEAKAEKLMTFLRGL